MLHIPGLCGHLLAAYCLHLERSVVEYRFQLAELNWVNGIDFQNIHDDPENLLV